MISQTQCPSYLSSTLGALCVLALLLAGATPSSADTITLTSVKDNTIYENSTGFTSNALYVDMFVGKTGSNDSFRLRRALVAFDLSAIPPNSTINTVRITMQCTGVSRDAGSIGTPVRLSRVLSDWGEGTSNSGPPGGTGAFATAGDATWQHTFFPGQTWNASGGDFVSSESASVVVVSPGPISWASNTLLVADVQAWIDDPATNFGWIMLGSEAQNSSAKRFASHEASTAGNRPSAFITFTPPVPNAAASVGSKKAEFGSQ